MRLEFLVHQSAKKMLLRIIELFEHIEFHIDLTTERLLEDSNRSEPEKIKVNDYRRSLLEHVDLLKKRSLDMQPDDIEHKIIFATSDLLPLEYFESNTIAAIGKILEFNSWIPTDLDLKYYKRLQKQSSSFTQIIKQKPNSEFEFEDCQLSHAKFVEAICVFCDYEFSYKCCKIDSVITHAEKLFKLEYFDFCHLLSNLYSNTNGKRIILTRECVGIQRFFYFFNLFMPTHIKNADPHLWLLLITDPKFVWRPDTITFRVEFNYELVNKIAKNYGENYTFYINPRLPSLFGDIHKPCRVQATGNYDNFMDALSPFSLNSSPENLLDHFSLKEISVCEHYFLKKNNFIFSNYLTIYEKVDLKTLEVFSAALDFNSFKKLSFSRLVELKCYITGGYTNDFFEYIREVKSLKTLSVLGISLIDPLNFNLEFLEKLEVSISVWRQINNVDWGNLKQLSLHNTRFDDDGSKFYTSQDFLSCPNIRSLQIRSFSHRLLDLTPLSSLKLEELVINLDSSINVDFSALNNSSLTLNYLKLSHINLLVNNPLCSKFEKITKLKFKFCNTIDNLDVLTCFPNLKRLNLSVPNIIQDKRLFENMFNLEQLIFKIPHNSLKKRTSGPEDCCLLPPDFFKGLTFLCDLILKVPSGDVYRPLIYNNSCEAKFIGCIPEYFGDRMELKKDRIPKQSFFKYFF